MQEINFLKLNFLKLKSWAGARSGSGQKSPGSRKKLVQIHNTTKLGTCDNCLKSVTMFSGLTRVAYCILSTLNVASLYIFSHWSANTLWYCCCHKADKLSHAQFWLQPSQCGQFYCGIKGCPTFSNNAERQPITRNFITLFW